MTALAVLLSVGATAGIAEPAVLTNVWAFQISAFSETCPAIGPDGTIYFGDSRGDFYALGSDGSSKWILHSGLDIHSSPAIGADGTIYFGGRDWKLHAFRPEGKKRWEFKTGGWVDSSPAITQDGTILFGSWDSNFYAVGPDGGQRWSFATKGSIVSSPAIDHDGRIYFGSHDSKLYALGPLGTPLWNFDTGGPIISSPALDTEGTIYFTSVDGYAYALSSAGVLKWKLKTGGITESSPVIGQDGTIYVGVNTSLWAISSAGRKLWDRSCGADLISTTPLALADGSVCCVSRQGVLMNIAGPDRVNWTFDEHWCGTLTPVIGMSGRVYASGHIVGTGTFLYSLPANAILAQSSWPKFRANSRNSGLASGVPHPSESLK